MTANPLLSGGAYIKIVSKLHEHLEECRLTSQFESQFHYRGGKDRPFALVYQCKTCNKKLWFELDDS